MRQLTAVLEFQEEAANAVFTKQQAVAATLQLLKREENDPANTAEETALFAAAVGRAEFRYIDATKTETDRCWTPSGWPVSPGADVVRAIHDLLFDVQ